MTTNWLKLIGKHVLVYLYAESTKTVDVTVTGYRNDGTVEFDNNNLWYDERELHLKKIFKSDAE